MLSQKVREKHQRTFESLHYEKDSIHIRLHSEGKGVCYVFQYGITSEEGVLTAKWEATIPLTVTEVIIDNLKSGSIVAIRYAVVKHPRHKAGAGPKLTKADPARSVNKVIIEPNIIEKGKVVFTHGTELLNFSDALYVIVP